MATSAQFSIAPSQAAEVPNSAAKGRSIFPVVITVPLVFSILVAVSIIWYCWFRKRRQQHRAQSRTPSPRQQRRSFIQLEPDNEVFKGPVCEAKPDIEERSADRDFGKRDSMHGQNPARRKSSMQLPLPPLPPPPPPALVEERAELPIFITPRSSRHVHPPKQPRTPTELDIYPPSPRPKSVDVGQGAQVNEPALSTARRSKRLSLQQLLHIRKVSELEGHMKSSSNSQDPAAKTEDATKDEVHDTQVSHPALRPKRFSLHSLLHLRRYAELEGSSTLPAQVSNTHPDHNKEMLHQSSRQSHRISLQRLLHSRRQAELEASTDILPKYSHNDSDRKSQVLSPPLPLKDMDFKDPLPSRAMTPVELDATEKNRTSSPSYELADSYNGQGQNSVRLAGSSSSHWVPEDRQAPERGNSAPSTDSQDAMVTQMKPSMSKTTHSSVPQTPEAVEFLDLASTCSEETYDEDFEQVPENAAVAQSNYATPLGSPPGNEERVDLLSPAEIISPATESSTRSLIVPHTEHIQKIDRGGGIPRKLLAMHEMDANESAIRRRSKRQSSYPSNFRHEAHRRRPDFVTFKKQMTEAERRAKMIAKRRRSRRRLTPKSF